MLKEFKYIVFVLFALSLTACGEEKAAQPVKTDIDKVLQHINTDKMREFYDQIKDLIQTRGIIKSDYYNIKTNEDRKKLNAEEAKLTEKFKKVIIEYGKYNVKAFSDAGYSYDKTLLNMMSSLDMAKAYQKFNVNIGHEKLDFASFLFEIPFLLMSPDTPRDLKKVLIDNQILSESTIKYVQSQMFKLK